jgi:hypothetical protein
MRWRILEVLIGASFAASCYAGDSLTLSSIGTIVDSTPVVFAPPNGAPAHGPTNRVTICVAPRYQLTNVGFSEPMFVREDRSAIILRVFVVFANAPRRPLERSGYTGCARHMSGLTYSEEVPEASGARARGIEVSANGPVQVDSVVWWSGDPRKLPVLP